MVVDEVPLPACILIAPSISFTWEVYPFRMSKLIAHEVKISSVDCRSRYKSYHLMQCNASAYVLVLVAFAEMPVHVGID